MKKRTIIISFIVLLMIAGGVYLIYSVTSIDTNNTPPTECGKTQVITTCSDGSTKCVTPCGPGMTTKFPSCGNDPCTSVCIKEGNICIKGKSCSLTKACPKGGENSTDCCDKPREFCDFEGKCSTCPVGDLCDNNDTCCSAGKQACCGEKCCDKGQTCADPETGLCCPLNEMMAVDVSGKNSCCKLTNIYLDKDGKAKCCTNPVCYNNGVATCCPMADSVCTIPSTCGPNKNNQSPSPPECAYIDKTGETKYVKIPGKWGCGYAPGPMPSGFDPNTKCLGWNQKGVTCYNVSASSDSHPGSTLPLIYTETQCDSDSNTQIYNGSQCSTVCKDEQMGGTGAPSGAPFVGIYCPETDTCGTITDKDNKTTAYCLIKGTGPIWGETTTNPQQLQVTQEDGSTRTLNTCGQYYQVDPKKIKKEACLLYDAFDGNVPNPSVTPLVDMEGKLFCPVSYSTAEKTYSTVKLGLTTEERLGSGLASVQLTSTGYAGYGGSGIIPGNGVPINPSKSSTDPNATVTYNENGNVSDPFRFGPYVHGMDDEMSSVLKSSSSVKYSGPAPRLVDCINKNNEPGLRDVNVNETNNTCNAHFSCEGPTDHYLDSPNKAWGAFPEASGSMVPTNPIKPGTTAPGTNKYPWTGGYCENGGIPTTGNIYNYPDKVEQPLSSFTRCRVRDLRLNKVVPGVY